MSSLSIGVTGMSVNQSLMDLIGQNLTNASNPAYHRQDATLSALSFGAATGAGVQISQVRRLIDNALDAAVNGNSSALSDTTQQLQTLQQVQTTLAPSGATGTLESLLESFFNDAQQLSAQPDDLTQRTIVLADAQSLTGALNDTASALGQTATDLTQQTQQLTDQVNQLATQVAALNGTIASATGTDAQTNALQDQRDGLIGQLSQLVNVRATPQSNGETNVSVGGLALVMGTQATALQASVGANNQALITTAGGTIPYAVGGGSLGAVLTVRNQLLPQVQNQLATFTTALTQALDSLQAQGLGLSGPQTAALGQRAVTSTTVPLAQAGLALPPRAGTLTISVTEQASGARTLTQLAIDPSTQSLADVATAISAIPHLQGIVNQQTGTLSILAQPGYAFDFAGRLSTAPDTQNITGTATAAIDGSYSGSTNAAFTYTVAGSGEVGAASDLSLEVRDASGTLLNTFNIGQGYQAGTDLATVAGLNVNLSAGTLNAGDTFTVQATANADTANLLPALGINTFFTGSDASNLAVNPNLLNAPAQLGLSSSGATGDAGNLQQLIALRDQPLLAGGTQTLSQYLSGLVGTVATRIQDLTTQQTTQQAVGQTLQAQQQSVSGVDPNEELVKLLQYQQGYQLSAHYISVVSQTMDFLLNITT